MPAHADTMRSATALQGLARLDFGRDAIPHLISLGLAACAGLIACAWPASTWAQQAAQAWPTTQFVVVPHAPNDEPWFGRGDPADRFSAADMRVITRFEAHLGRVAKEYERMGFPAPKLPIRAGRKTGEAFLVNFHDYDDALPPALAGYSSDRKFSLEVDASRAIVNGAASSRIFDDLAHELFHNVQHAIHDTHNGDKAFNLDRGKWIMEGMAEAVGTDTSERLGAVHKSSDDGYRLGLRDYGRPLETGEKSASYATMSFWRYLGEAHAAARRNVRLTSHGIAPDYSYLVKVLANPFRGPVSLDGDLAWLDRGLRNATRQGLPRHYANFVAAYADYAPARLTSFSTTPAAARKTWLDAVFGACPDAGSITPPFQTSHQVLIARNAAACFHVDLSSIGQTNNVRIEYADTDKGLLEQLHIGMPDGSFVSAPTIATNQKTGIHVASWTFPVVRDANGRSTFIVSNMAKDPTRTRAQGITLKIATDGYGFTMDSGNQGPLPAPPIYGPTQEQAGRTSDPTPTRREVVERRLREKAAREPTVEDLIPVNDVDLREDSGSDCSAMRRGLNLCGDQLVIRLELSLAAQQRNMLEAGAFDMFGAVFGIDGESMLADSGRIALTGERLIGGTTGSRISIRIPMVDYGFTGGFDNAVIEVSKADDDRHGYKAFGPRVYEGRRPHRRPPTGQVTILEYSPTVLRGSFRAGLVDEASPGSDDAPTIATRIEGEFIITSPWQGDPGFALDKGAAREALIQNMLQQSPLGTDAMRELIRSSGASPQALCDAGLDDGQLEALGFATGCGPASSSSGGAVSTPCSCECDMRPEEEKNPACPLACRAAWAACPAAAPTALGANPQDAEEIETQAAWLEERLREKNIPGAVRTQILEMFRKSPALSRDLMLKQHGG